jgi:hypothetical protein
LLNLNELEKAGITVRQFCGLDEQEDIACSREAVGEIIAQLENGQKVPIPICQEHLELIASEFTVENI